MPALEQHGDDRFAPQGELNLASVQEVWEQSQRLFERQAPRCIDLAGVTHSDSAGVALLVEWLRLARQSGQTVRFVNIPPQMLAIIRVTGLDGLLPLA